MKYSDALLYMYNALPMFHRQGKTAYKKDLNNINALCEALGNPQQSLKCVHIAGTNGKGSVTHMLAAVLQAHGFRTGVYVSPHYKDFRERIKINGEYISKSFVCKFIDQNKSLFESVEPSFFEMTVALAFCWFKKQKVDYAVIETGLGGRLDSTNIIHPLLSIITNISWDHSDMLGDTLEKIAFEKAGIIKPSVPVLIGKRQEHSKEVFKETSERQNADLYYADELVKDFFYINDGLGLLELSAIVLDSKKRISPCLKGIYQWENIRTSIAACSILKNKASLPLSADKIVFALENTKELTRIIGRWQIISEKPLMICESAHNEEGILFLTEQLNNMKFNQLHIVFGFVKEKPLEAIFSLLPKEARYYFVKADIPRAMDAKELQMVASAFGIKGKSYQSVRRGLASAKKVSGLDDLIIITGSIFVVAEVI